MKPICPMISGTESLTSSIFVQLTIFTAIWCQFSGHSFFLSSLKACPLKKTNVLAVTDFVDGNTFIQRYELLTGKTNGEIKFDIFFGFCS
jgi:hypothetical protein